MLRAFTQSRSRGSVIMYGMIALIGISAMVVLGVDVGHVRLVKIQLQNASDAAARVGARSLGSSASAVQTAIIAAAAANIADNSPVVVTTNDIDFGTWSNGTFTVLDVSAATTANAVRVRCSRTAARGNAVASFFGGWIGVVSKDVITQSTAMGTARPRAGFIGYAGINLKNNAFFGAYDSSVTTSPTANSCDSNMRVGTNYFIKGKNNNLLDGDAILGPGADVTGFTVLGTKDYETSPIPTYPLPTWSAGTNPNGIPQVYSVTSDTTLPAGTYWFTSLSATANLTFAGPSTVYVNGPIVVSQTLTAASGIPADLVIYQYGNNTFGDANSNQVNIAAEVYAPGCAFSAKNNLNFEGSGVFNSIDTAAGPNNANFFYDESQGPFDGRNAVSMVE